MNGHDLILSDYCGVAQGTPILGEVQHSFFVSTHHFDVHGKIGPPRSSGRTPMVPLFSWNEVLKFRFQRPIGDPLQYLFEFGQPPVTTNQNRSILLMPKKNDELAPHDRIRAYSRLIEFARDVAPSEQLVLSLHPAENAITERLLNKYNFLLRPENTKKTSTAASIQLARISGAKIIVSDYLGAHVIRGSAYFGTKILLPSGCSLPKAVDSNLRPYLEGLMDRSVTPTEVRSISQILVGTRHKKSPEELRSLIFRTERPEIMKKIQVGFYKKGRRARVKIRQSKWLGKSSPVKLVRRHVAERLWNEKFKGPE